MTPAQFNTALQKLELNQIDVARFLGIVDRQVRRYASGEHPVPRMVEMILAYLVKTGTSPEDFLKAAGLKSAGLKAPLVRAAGDTPRKRAPAKT